MSERLYNLAAFSVMVAILIATNALHVSGVIDVQTNTLIVGITLGGGVGVVGGTQIGKSLPTKPPAE